MVTGSEETARLVGSLLYPLGFLLIVAGRYQLFTENTLTPVTLVLTGHCSVWTLLRVWGVVLAGNVVGAGLVALALAHTPVFSPEAAQAAHQIASHAMEGTWTALFWQGVFAGWLMASIVWLVHAAQESTLRFLIVFLITYTIPVSGFAHCVVGVSEGLYVVFSGTAGLADFLSYFSAAAVGNTAGGVFLVAVLNYAQTEESK
jgi:formate/nitrite transporter FocA (FNT family)